MNPLLRHLSETRLKCLQMDSQSHRGRLLAGEFYSIRFNCKLKDKLKYLPGGGDDGQGWKERIWINSGTDFGEKKEPVRIKKEDEQMNESHIKLTQNLATRFNAVLVETILSAHIIKVPIVSKK